MGYNVAVADDFVNFNLRLPRELHERLKSAADQSDRSIHGQILACLRSCVTQPERTAEARGPYATDPPSRSS